jgi:hypothetical protein
METDERMPLDRAVEQRVIGLTRQNKQFEAVREVRRATGLGLAEAKRLVDEIHAANPPAADIFEAPAGREEAVASLAAVSQARAAGFAPIPAWFFPAVALLVAGMMALQALGSRWLGLPAIGLLVVAYVVIERLYARQVRLSGAAPRELTWRQQAILVVPLVLLWVAGEILDGRGGWVWGVVALAGAAWTIGYGVVHNRGARERARARASA